MTLRLLLLTSALIVAGCGTAADTSPDTVQAQTAVSQGMVTAANPYAVEAGADILRAGGSAVDAAVAVQAVLGLVEPQSSGLGGGAFMVLHDPKTDKTWTYDGRETAPAAATSALFLDESGQPLRYFDGIASGRSTGVPGAVAMLGMAHADYGKLDWSETFNPAIALAEDGFVVSPRMADLVARMGRFVLPRDDNARAYFFVDGDPERPIPAGFKRDNPAYADTLRAIAADPRALLTGPIAQAIIDKTREAPLPGTLTLDDMANYQPIKKPALCSTYRNHRLCSAPPPSSGGVGVQAILGMLEPFDMARVGPGVEGWHYFIEASQLAYADRDRYVGDPAFVTVPIDTMLDKGYLAGRSGLIKPMAALANYPAGNLGVAGTDATAEVPGTSHFTIVDADGLIVSMTTTVEAPFGSQRMVRGFMLNNELTDFSFRPTDDAGNPIANRVQPGKRPRSSMAPHIVFGPNGDFAFATGSPGGNAILAYTAKSIVGMIDWNLSAQDAINLPNVIARNGTVRMEARDLPEEDTDEVQRAGPAQEFGMQSDIIEGLESMGHDIVRSRGEISGLHIIHRLPDGTLDGGADPRREGIVIRVDNADAP
ncbi:gamma-glutamyltransferase family protein [Algimonas porphyrae]|uniref:Gamma-glutamyltransferase n=1 Tax=Algimonas porphyrae TaxID=1128113 RepID=A0ABQ5V4N2_9PROT|nr:gamma-glutamyltransferase family protein [Algimonas porphyrae]GLQ21561.1 gamma-glutamyltransferase [Algimonas porphyrae]